MKKLTFIVSAALMATPSFAGVSHLADVTIPQLVKQGYKVQGVGGGFSKSGSGATQFIVTMLINDDFDVIQCQQRFNANFREIQHRCYRLNDE